MDTFSNTNYPIQQGVWKKDTWALFFCYDNSIHFFRNDGKFIRKIEKRGRGRGEYLNINRFDLDIKNQNT